MPDELDRCWSGWGGTRSLNGFKPKIVPRGRGGAARCWLWGRGGAQLKQSFFLGFAQFLPSSHGSITAAAGCPGCSSGPDDDGR